jgi:hypothetical protein
MLRVFKWSFMVLLKLFSQLQWNFFIFLFFFRDAQPVYFACVLNATKFPSSVTSHYWSSHDNGAISVTFVNYHTFLCVSSWCNSINSKKYRVRKHGVLYCESCLNIQRLQATETDLPSPTFSFLETTHETSSTVKQQQNFMYRSPWNATQSSSRNAQSLGREKKSRFYDSQIFVIMFRGPVA